MFTVWLVFVCAWGCDTCAYCVGMLIGKHKMAPVLSPKKSVEGGIGGIVGAALIGTLYALAINHWGGAGAEVIEYALIERSAEPSLRSATWLRLPLKGITISRITES